MNFLTEEARNRIEREYDGIRKRIAVWQEEPETLAFITRDCPHVMKRFELLSAMSREELIQELEADYILLSGCAVD